MSRYIVTEHMMYDPQEGADDPCYRVYDTQEQDFMDLGETGPTHYTTWNREVAVVKAAELNA